MAATGSSAGSALPAVTSRRPPPVDGGRALVASHRTRGVGGTAVQTNTECDAWWNVARATVGTVAATSFRIRIAGSEHIPRHGGALIAYNHVSVLDAIFIGLPVTRRGRIVRCFALSEDFERPLMGRALRGSQTGADPPRGGGVGPARATRRRREGRLVGGHRAGRHRGARRRAAPRAEGRGQDRVARRQPRDPGRLVGTAAALGQGGPADGAPDPAERRRLVRRADPTPRAIPSRDRTCRR